MHTDLAQRAELLIGDFGSRLTALCLLLVYLALIGGCGRAVSIDGKVVTDDGKIIRGGTIAISELGALPKEETVRGLWVTDQDGRFHAGVRGVSVSRW